MKTPLRTLLSIQKKALKAAQPRSRDRIRHRVNVLEMAVILRKKSRAA